MAWTNLPTFVAGSVPGAADFNAYIRDDLTYLLSGRAKATKVYVGAADLSTTSLTFVDVDATNLKVSLGVVNSGNVLVLVQGQWRAESTATTGAEFDVIMDSTTRAGNATHGLWRVSTGATQSNVLVASFSGVSVGSHDFKVQYRAVSAGQATVWLNGYPLVMVAMEV